MKRKNNLFLLACFGLAGYGFFNLLFSLFFFNCKFKPIELEPQYLNHQLQVTQGALIKVSRTYSQFKQRNKSVCVSGNKAYKGLKGEIESSKRKEQGQYISQSERLRIIEAFQEDFRSLDHSYTNIYFVLEDQNQDKWLATSWFIGDFMKEDKKFKKENYKAPAYFIDEQGNTLQEVIWPQEQF